MNVCSGSKYNYVTTRVTITIYYTYIIIFIFIGICMYSQIVSIQQADKYTQYYMTIYYCVV